MRNLLLFVLVMCVGALSAQSVSDNVECVEHSSYELCLADAEGIDIEALIDGINKSSCTFTKNGKTFNLYGKVQIVSSFPDIKVQIVDSFPDIDVQLVNSFPTSCGKVQIVTSFPDVKVQIVDSFPDIKVRIVDSFPGVK